MNANKKFTGSYLNYLLITLTSVLLMYFGRALFIPLSFGLLIALVLYPFCAWLEGHKCPRSIAIFISLTIVIILFVAIVWVLFWQLNFLKDEMGNSLFTLFITPVFTALFLFHRQQFVSFVKSLFSDQHHARLHIVLHEVCFVYNKYIIGLLKVYLIVGVLNSIGLLLLGIEHAILFGMLTAFMTMVPYVGIVISSLLPITVAWLSTGSLFYPLAVVLLFTFVQYLENSIIFPNVVGIQLNVSSWAILVALIAGGIIWGVVGMILFMPFVAILKIISDNIEEWKPLNILLSRTEK